jgi:hypothetical protein
MGFFGKVLASVGVGGAKVAVKLNPGPVRSCPSWDAAAPWAQRLARAKPYGGSHGD